jgi:hypothetical protein
VPKNCRGAHKLRVISGRALLPMVHFGAAVG